MNFLKNSPVRGAVRRTGRILGLVVLNLLGMVLLGSATMPLPSDAGQAALEQQTRKNISGVITDSNGMPIPGASVVVKGTTVGTITGTDGKFALEVPSDAQMLVISFVGMRTLEMVVGDQLVFNVVLEEETIGLQEVVAVG
ncbi:MAG TPA: carboxypeptidase-like regulatory domain-containing protein, partial [Prolixibacteraceae bacterium]|nr:carboxypeptidase-like regulatory domain-containing protein [Prolixibacteraceae bacterium]